MFGIGIPELVLILIVGLIVFGPSKLPEIGRTVGKGLREFRKASNALQAAINAPDDPPAKTSAVQAQPSGETAAAEASRQETPAPESVARAEENAGASATMPGYEPPTQESVRAQLEKQKNA